MRSTKHLVLTLSSSTPTIWATAIFTARTPTPKFLRLTSTNWPARGCALPTHTAHPVSARRVATPCSPAPITGADNTVSWGPSARTLLSRIPTYHATTSATGQNGYTTACIGKWHLGWDWTFKNEPTGEVEQWGKTRAFYRAEDVDWSVPIKGGPLARGFDYYFGDGTINFPPYAWVENDALLEVPTTELDINNIGYETKEGNWEFRPGPMVAGWNPYEVLPTLTEKTVAWIKEQDAERPFFLYFALPSPHAPIIPNAEFVGSSQAGGYGDFMVQTDWVAGQVLRALQEKGLAENTIVIFSSDNGPEHYAFERAETYQHLSMGDFRGLKRDVWEGGHHVPFIVRWPGTVAAGAVSDETISQVDMMATLAAVTQIDLPEQAAPDSYNLLPVFSGESYSSPLREATVHNTYENIWGLRQGQWLYINDSTGEHSKMPESFKALRGYQDFETKGLLFDLKSDPGQRNNLYTKHPDKIETMNKLLHTYRRQGYSVR